MNLQEYIEFTDGTAIYPDANTGNPLEAMYLLLGLLSEYHEYIRSYYSSTEDTISELGDCFWYLARLQKLFGVKVTEEFYTMFDMAGYIKKYYRDGTINENIPKWIEARWASLIEDLEDLNEGSTVTYSVEDVLDMNVKKLTARMKNNTIKGSGDNR